MVAVRTTDYSKKHGLATPSPIVCPGEECCLGCSWSSLNGGYCAGCEKDYQQRCVKRICILNCDTCSGGRHAFTPGCCGRAPASWLEQWERLLREPIPDYAPMSLPIRCRLIPVIYAQIKKYRIPEQFPQIDTWAVPIHKVASRKGRFRSNDLKEYLGLPNDRKLILSTCAADDYQEMLWKEGQQLRLGRQQVRGMDYEQHNIDYWFPGHFSVYDDDSKLYQFISAKRQQLHAILTKSQFVWFRLGEDIPVNFLAPIRKAASVLISTQQMYSKHNRAILNNEVRVADSWFSPETAFFVVGSRRHLPISSKRTCFEINSNWLMRALKGRNMANRPEPNLTKGELLAQNLKEVLENVHATC